MPELIDKALLVHAQIKRRLCEAIRQPGLMQPDDIRSENQCAIGQWIYSADGMQQWRLPEFRLLVETHRKFHEAAYQTALMVETGRSAEAEISIEQGTFEMASRALTQSLIDMKAIKVAQRAAEGAPN